jgi:glycosyltransferase involved in cell wall biosynthesis
MDQLNVVYYGYVFDASGYGHAARAYIHALNEAGVTLSVVNLSGSGMQVGDGLVESLIGRKISADFHIFHGVPPQWARLAFRLSNAIGMTVWETDTMPTQWRNVLNHTLEVWLPSEFNVGVFSRALERPVFKLPHPLMNSPANGHTSSSDSDQFPGVEETDFVFYSIFEWQERKSPEGLIDSFLRAFPARSDALLLIKTNPGAADLVKATVETSRRKIASEARIEIRPEAWNESRIRALHARGDCYVSLHRGEGWGYPLFEAAARGKPVVATDYSGPLDYLDPKVHCLVRTNPAAVHQRYLYYHPGMNWAEPDLDHASELMRWVYENRDEACSRAADEAERISSAYSLQAVGEMAKERMLQLLKRTRPDKWARVASAQQAQQFAPAVPIPPEWYDQDYFETGLKSNWDQGYTWRVFSELFNETADFLCDIFQEADSYLDVGCAKGFLVRTLRARGKDCWGFDHSRWAVTRSEAASKPFIMQSSIDEVSFDRQFDVLVAFSIFESLTPAQARSFLERARRWTRQAIVATIPSFEEEGERPRPAAEDRDLSHINMKSRGWWHDLFLSAGWRQDSVHRIAERLCRTHPLPSRMGWKLYLYTPVQ